MAPIRASSRPRGAPGPIARSIIGDGAKASQIRAQYDALKREHPDRILFVQIGDFYETFEGDAAIVARVCDITLTSKEFAKGDRVALAGVPVVRAAPHIGKLVAAGYHVAICDQVREAGKGLVERQVTRVITPGTVAEPGLVPPQEHNLLVALLHGRDGIGVASADVTTGEVTVTVVSGDDRDALLAAELQRLSPSEVLVVRDETAPAGAVGHVTGLDRARFDGAAADDALRRLFKVSTLDGFGLSAGSPALGALGALVAYVGDVNYRLLASLRQPKAYAVGSHMTLDPSTRRNLELSRTARSNQSRGSLVHAVDRTRTAMGARRLRRVLGQPLLDVPLLERRLDGVEELVDDPIRRGRLRAALGKLGDVERLFGRIRQLTASPRDALTLARAIRELPLIRDSIQPADSALLRDLADALVGCDAVADAIDAALAEPGTPRTIRPGYSAELDGLIDGIGEARAWLAHLERGERERTGIRSLKVGFNRVTGYYIEVTRANGKHVPDDYIRRQSLVNAERFVTPDLKEREARILTAEARIEELEQALFLALLRRVGEEARPILVATDALADLDVLAALADVAVERAWTRPQFAQDDALTIEGGRHPVLEALLPPGDVVPNDSRLGGDDAGRVHIVTGPNMGGKSTYLRQVALVVLLAQSGSFVPATRATVGLVDRLFTRVGSQDDLVAGASTFLVEMAETANILRHATSRSLVVLDEVGRGTSTHDGMCIAQAVLEHLHDTVCARTLFATHFHELTALADALGEVRNVTVAVDDADDNLAFLYRVVPGAANRSYGVQVARLAGLPAVVTARAAELLRVREAPVFEEIVADVGHGGWEASERDRPATVAPERDAPERATAEHAACEREVSGLAIDAAPLVLDARDSFYSEHALDSDYEAGTGADGSSEHARDGLAVRESGATWLVSDAPRDDDAPSDAALLGGMHENGLADEKDADLGVFDAPPAAVTNDRACRESRASTTYLHPVPAATADARAAATGSDDGRAAEASRLDGRASAARSDAAENGDERGIALAASERAETEAAQTRGTAALPSHAAAQVFGDLLALDLSSLTPLQALIRLHQLQESARGSVPWSAWLSDLAGADRSESLGHDLSGRSSQRHIGRSDRS